jgi:hypothetical protein
MCVLYIKYLCSASKESSLLDRNISNVDMNDNADDNNNNSFIQALKNLVFIFFYLLQMFKLSANLNSTIIFHLYLT